MDSTGSGNRVARNRKYDFRLASRRWKGQRLNMVKSLGTLLLVELDSGQACSADYLMDFFGCLLNEDTDLFNLYPAVL